MALLAKVGERLYEFASRSGLSEARAIYARFAGSQDELEVEMERSEIDFFVEAEFFDDQDSKEEDFS